MKKALAFIAGACAMVAQAGIDVTFIIDESGSMRDDQADVQANANNIFAGLPAGSHGAVVGYGGLPPDPRLVQPMTSDSGVFAAGIGALNASGGLEQGYLAVTQTAKDSLPQGSVQYTGDPRCHIQISDETLDQGGATAADAVIELTTGPGAGVYFAILPTSLHPDAAPLVAATGGAVFDLAAFRADPVPVLDAVIAACVEAVIPVALDIKPTSCPNPHKFGKKGVLPVALLGSEDFDASTIDPASLVLNGECAVIRTELEDVATPFDGERTDPPLEDQCTTEGADGYVDLTAKFDNECATATSPATDRTAEVWEVCGTYDAGEGPVEFCASDVVRPMP